MYRELSDERLKEMFDSFPEFLSEVWYAIGLPDPAPIQKDIAWHLQHGPDAMQIQALRGAAKSWMTCAFVCWTLWRDSEAEVLIVSASGGTADNFSYLIKQWITNIHFLQHLLPRVNQRNTANEFDVGTREMAGASASVRSKGITGMITGGRASLIVGDDIETPDNSGTVVQRDNIRRKVTEFEAILHPGGRIIYLGTPHHEDSVYSKLEKDGYTLYRWPAEFPKLDDLNEAEFITSWMKKRVEDNPSIIGHSTYPERFSDEDLAERRARMGHTAYKLQYLLNRSLSNIERYPLKIKDCINYGIGLKEAPVSFTYAAGQNNIRKDLDSVGFVGDYWYQPMKADDLVMPYEDIVMSVDPAGTGGDETAYCIAGFLAGNMYLIKTGGLQGGFQAESLKELCQQAWEHRVRKVILERNLGAGTFTELFKNNIFQFYKENPFYVDRSQAMVPEITDVWVKGQKERRIIEILEPLFNQHRVIVSDLVAKDTDLWYQVTHLSHDRGCLVHDDRVDALSLLGTALETTINVDLDYLKESLQQKKVEELHNEYAKNMRIPVTSIPEQKYGRQKRRWIR